MVTKGKNYNSIVFLTTLSVYLGLVLVGGATPQVMAQAALTRNFDIQTEIEIEDDLDKKPDDGVIGGNEKADFRWFASSYFDKVGDFVGEDLYKLQRAEKFDLNHNVFAVIESSAVSPCKFDNDFVDTSRKRQIIVDDRSFIDALLNASHNFVWDLSDCSDAGGETLKENKYKDYSLDVFYDKSELKIEISAFKSTPQRAEQLAENLLRAFKFYEADEENEQIVVKEVTRNTSISFENNQVFIVTRLPRGSIDSLLANKSAQ